MPVKNLQISEEDSGQRLDNFLLRTLKSVPKSRIYSMIRRGEVRLNSSRTKPSIKLKFGDFLRVPPVTQLATNKPIDTKLLPAKHKNFIDPLYENNELMVLNKPSGLAVHGGSGLNYGLIELLRNFSKDYINSELVHRLDKETSGCILIAKKRSALRNLHLQFREKKIKKIYHAVVVGKIVSKIVIEAPLKKFELSGGERLVKVTADGAYAKSVVTPIEYFPNCNCSLVAVSPITGRTHQIRVHLASKGNPILGDLKYGDKAKNKFVATLKCNRLFLHAKQLNFYCPKTNKNLCINAPYNTMFNSLLEQFREKDKE